MFGKQSNGKQCLHRKIPAMVAPRLLYSLPVEAIRPARFAPIAPYRIWTQSHQASSAVGTARAHRRTPGASALAT